MRLKTFLQDFTLLLVLYIALRWAGWDGNTWHWILIMLGVGAASTVERIRAARVFARMRRSRAVTMTASEFTRFLEEHGIDPKKMMGAKEKE